MCDFTTDDTRIYAPAENVNVETEGFPQLTTVNTGWKNEEQNSMRQHGYDSMDMLRAWLD